MGFVRPVAQTTRGPVLITGASAGIGRALAFEYARRGHSLALLARRLDKLEGLAVDLRAQFAGIKVYVAQADVTHADEVRVAVIGAEQALGPLEVVIANAGFGVGGAFERLTLGDFKRQFDTNVWGLLQTIQSTLPSLLKTGGRLCLIGSVSGYVSLPFSTPYSMSKFAVRALAEGLFLELKSKGVSVTLVSPGFVESEIRNGGGDKDPIPHWLQMPAPLAAQKIYRAVQKRRRERILTVHGHFGVWASLYLRPLLFKVLPLVVGSSRHSG